MSQASLIFIESNTSGTGRLFAQTAISLGYYPIVVSERPERYPYLAQDNIETIQEKTSDLESVAKRIESLRRKTSVRGIYSSSDYFIETSAALARRFGLFGPDPRAISVCRNKWRQRDCLEKGGVPGPAYIQANSAPAAVNALKTITMPVVVKPVEGSGSVGVKLCRTRQEVEEHSAFLLSQTVNERGLPRTRAVLVEEYIAAPEFSVETFGSSIIGITRKHISPEPYFVETGHDFPAVIERSKMRIIEDTARGALAVLGLDWGPAHIELRMTESGPVIIEVNPRLAGGFIPEIVRLALGAEMIRATISAAVGQKPDLSVHKDDFAVIRFIIPGVGGTLSNITGLQQATESPGVADIQLYRGMGDAILIQHDFRDRVGHIIACGKSEEQAVKAVEAALAGLHLEIGESSVQC